MKLHTFHIFVDHLFILFCEVPPVCFSIRLSFFCLFFFLVSSLHILDTGLLMVICVTKIFWEEFEMSNKLTGKDLGKKKNLCTFFLSYQLQTRLQL